MSREQLIFALLDIAAVAGGFATARLHIWTPMDAWDTETLWVLASCLGIMAIVLRLFHGRPRYRPQIQVCHPQVHIDVPKAQTICKFS